VMELAQRLPVAFIPEQFMVALMWDDMVDDSGCGYHPFRLAYNTQRVLS